MRQFRIPDKEWFDGLDSPHLHAWLQNFLKSDRLSVVMHNITRMESGITTLFQRGARCGRHRWQTYWLGRREAGDEQVYELPGVSDLELGTFWEDRISGVSADARVRTRMWGGESSMPTAWGIEI